VVSSPDPEPPQDYSAEEVWSPNDFGLIVAVGIITSLSFWATVIQYLNIETRFLIPESHLSASQLTVQALAEYMAFTASSMVAGVVTMLVWYAVGLPRGFRAFAPLWRSALRVQIIIFTLCAVFAITWLSPWVFLAIFLLGWGYGWTYHDSVIESSKMGTEKLFDLIYDWSFAVFFSILLTIVILPSAFAVGITFLAAPLISMLQIPGIVYVCTKKDEIRTREYHQRELHASLDALAENADIPAPRQAQIYSAISNKPDISRVIHAIETLRKLRVVGESVESISSRAARNDFEIKKDRVSFARDRLDRIDLSSIDRDLFARGASDLKLLDRKSDELTANIQESEAEVTSRLRRRAQVQERLKPIQRAIQEVELDAGPSAAARDHEKMITTIGVAISMLRGDIPEADSSGWAFLTELEMAESQYERLATHVDENTAGYDVLKSEVLLLGDWIDEAQASLRDNNVVMAEHRLESIRPVLRAAEDRTIVGALPTVDKKLTGYRTIFDRLDERVSLTPLRLYRSLARNADALVRRARKDAVPTDVSSQLCEEAYSQLQEARAARELCGPHQTEAAAGWGPAELDQLHERILVSRYIDLVRSAGIRADCARRADLHIEDVTSLCDNAEQRLEAAIKVEAVVDLSNPVAIQKRLADIRSYRADQQVRSVGEDVFGLSAPIHPDQIPGARELTERKRSLESSRTDLEDILFAREQDIGMIEREAIKKLAAISLLEAENQARAAENLYDQERYEQAASHFQTGTEQIEAWLSDHKSEWPAEITTELEGLGRVCERNDAIARRVKLDLAEHTEFIPIESGYRSEKGSSVATMELSYAQSRRLNRGEYVDAEGERSVFEYDAIEKGGRIGSGGNADVYQATVATGGEEWVIALKEPRFRGTLQSVVTDQFVTEAERWSRLDDHDHITTVLAHGSVPLPWIAIEYMNEGDLSAIANSLDMEARFNVAIDVTDAVWHAHQRGIAHLDLKPPNILFKSGAQQRAPVAKVADWGLSKMLLDHSTSIDGLSPRYSAPEQFDSETFGGASSQTDIYQLGLIFYELFTETHPYEGSAAQIMHETLEGNPEAPSSFAPELPTEIDDVILTAMAKNPSERYEAAVELRDALQELSRV
jgi:hypothetical protein